jgi:hypothetical protein
MTWEGERRVDTSNVYWLYKRLWRWYINTYNVFLDIFHGPVFYLKRNVLETGVSLRRHVKPYLVGPDWLSFCLKTKTESSLRNIVF